MGDILTDFSMPSFDLTGFLSGTWIYVFLVVVFGIVLIGGIVIALFFLSYNKKVVLFENISGQGYQPILKTRARTLKLGVGGEELLKTLKGGQYVSAYGRKMGKNTFWYAKGPDGYWYNFLLGDLDAKMAILDVEPVDRDVRMFHVALDRLSHDTYGKTNWFEKHSVHILLFIFLLALILGMWFITAKVGDAVAPLAQNQEMALKLTEAQERLTTKMDSILRSMGRLDSGTSSGLSH